MAFTDRMLLLRNPRLPELRPVAVEAQADTGSLHLCITEAVRLRLGLEPIDSRDVWFPDGTVRRVPYVGPVELRFKDRTGFAGALVMGEEVRLGVIPMQDLDLVVAPITRAVAANPLSPGVGTSIACPKPHRRPFARS